MKLQARYNRITIVSTLLVLTFAAVGYYFLVRYVLIGQLDEALKVEEVEIHDYVSKHNRLPEATVYKDQRIAFEKTELVSFRRFKSLQAFHPGENSMEPSRQLQFIIVVNGQRYLATVTKSEEATENLIWIIVLITIAIIILLMMVLFLTNRFLFKNLWKPFRSTLSSIKVFNVSEPTDIKTVATTIREFNELNESIRIMTDKVKRDYESLKNFTDHASHEMQTPLAVINSKLDILIQSPELSEQSMNQVQGIYTAVDKLSRLSQSLLLLTKIENNQYAEVHIVPVHTLVAEKTAELQEWLGAKHLRTEQELTPLSVSMNKELADILVSNLLNNAIRHTQAGEVVYISAKQNVLKVCNPGNTPLNKERIFDRFAKSDSSEGSGLGLAIVKQICEEYKLDLSYEFIDGHHQFKVVFLPK